MTITELLNSIKSAVYGSEVRLAIHDAIKKAYDDASEQGNANMEVEMARGTEPTLNDRLGKMDDKDQEVTAQLAQKASKDLVQQLNLSYKESFPTLADLESAYPTGDTFNHVVLDNGMIYTYVNSQWVNTEIQANGTGVADGSITHEKLSFPAIQGEDSKNLFNKDDVNNVDGMYVDHTTGTLAYESNYMTSDYIEIQPDTDYVRKVNQRYAIYDIDKNYLRGEESATALNTGANARYIRISLRKVDAYREQFERGTDSTVYEPFGARLPYIKLRKDFLTVSKNKYGDFESIMDAVNSVSSFQPMTTIFVMPGIYEESVNLIGKRVNLVGYDKNTTIVRTYTNDYYHPPLDAGAQSRVENITFIADDDGITTPKAGVNNLPAYAIHFDLSGRYDTSDPIHQGHSIAKDCVFIAKNNSAGGIGLTHKTKLSFDNCFFHGYKNYGVRAHNSIYDAHLDQYMAMKNCQIKANAGNKPLYIQDENNNYSGASGTDRGNMTVELINNLLYNDWDNKANTLKVDAPASEEFISGYVKLAPQSYGNSLDVLNG